MKRYALAALLTFSALVLSLITPAAKAASPPVLAAPSGLALIEIKITGNEFVMLQNNTQLTVSDLSKYWLYDFNNVNPLASGVSSSTQQLPAASLAPGQTILLNSTGGQTCGAAVTAKLSISLTDSGGFLEVVQTSLVGGVLQQTAGDAVSWSSGANSAQGMIANVPSSTADPAGAYYRYQSSASSLQYSWQLSDVDAANSCQLDVKLAGVSTPGPANPGNQLSVGAPPPAVFIQADDSQTQGASLPASDIGLAAPIVNELLPNPAEPQSDNEDEFIELYNPNDKAFNLTGFKLQVGTRTLHDYNLPSGTTLPPKSFTAFYSVDTNLSLSNTSGQANLLDPFGNIISQTNVYNTAKEGQTWSLANGAWYWTTTPTPNATNIIKLPQAKSSAKKSVSKSTALPSSKVKTASSINASTAGTSPLPTPQQSSGLHPAVLVGVGSLALLYAAYEYRHDLANRLYQFRRYRTNRRATRETA